MLRYLTIGENAPISTYNLLLGLGMVAFFLSLEKVINKNAISSKKADEIKTMTFLSAILGVVGATLGEALYHRTETGLVFSGFTFYGGLLAAMLGLWLQTTLRKISFFSVANILIVPLVLAHAFGRVGCFLGGCCYGSPSHHILGVSFPEGSLPFKHYGAQPLHPVQLYESFLLFILAILVSKLKINFRLSAYLIAYSLIRFTLEFYRADNRGTLISSIFSPSQEISIALFIFGVSILLLEIKKSRLHFTIN